MLNYKHIHVWVILDVEKPQKENSLEFNIMMEKSIIYFRDN